MTARSADSSTFGLFFRPCPLVLEETPEPGGVLALLTELEEHWGEVGNFPLCLEPVFYGLLYEPATRSFWEDREPVAWLGEVTAKGVLYIRLQGPGGHTKSPADYHDRQAVECLHAAFQGCGGRELVRFSDKTYVDSKDAEPPTLLASDIDPDLYSLTAWPEWSPDVAFLSTIWVLQVDTVRWVLDPS